LAIAVGRNVTIVNVNLVAGTEDRLRNTVSSKLRMRRKKVKRMKRRLDKFRAPRMAKA
jgi:hypothetical protein